MVSGARCSKACAEMDFSARTLRRWTKGGVIRADQRPLVQRPEPHNKLTQAERTAVLRVCNSEEFSSLPPSQIVPALADRGQYLASESSFYRILRHHGQQHHRGRAKHPIRRKPPTSFKASRPCQVWTWDITWMPGPVKGQFFHLYLILDVFSRKVVGWEVFECETAENAATLIQRTVWSERCFINPVVLHADNGSPMKGATMKATLEKLGILASYSRPRVSNDNPFSEALFRTCKYRPNWPKKGFATRMDAQTWVKSFADWYNNDHLHSAIRFVTPNMRHTGNEGKTLAKRASLYAKARAARPERWSSKTRNWTPVGPVWLNPEKEENPIKTREAA